MDNKLFVVAKREYLERVRSKWFIWMTLLVPALLAVAIIVPTYIALRSNASNAVRHITIIDATGAGLGDRIAKALMADSSLGARVSADTVAPRVQVVSVSEIADKEKAATADVQQPNHIAGYLVLTDSTLAGKSARYAGRNASTVSDVEKLTNIVRDEVMMVRLEREGVRKDIIGDLATTKLRFNTERLTERGRSGSGGAGLIAGIAVGVMLFMSIIFHGQNILRGVLEEKSTRVAEVVISSVKPETLLAGKVLGVGAVGLTQQIAWFGISFYLLNFIGPVVMKGMGGGGAAPTAMGGAFSSMTPAVLGVALVYFIIGFVFYATLYAAAGSMVNSEQEAQQAAIPVMLLLMSTWLLVNPVITNPNSTLSVVLSWLPWSSPIIMPMRMGLTSVSPVTIAGSIIVAIVGSIAAMMLSARIYRVGMLMYGKKPGFAEVLKWIRYA